MKDARKGSALPKAAQAKTLSPTKGGKRLRSWLILTAVVVSIALFYGPFPSWEANRFAKTTYHLEAGKWSDWIITPAESKYRIDTSVPVEVCFIDNPECDEKLTFTVYPSEYKKPTWFGLRRGIFKLWASEPARVTVTIER